MERNLKTPLLTVDIIIRIAEGIVLIERKNAPSRMGITRRIC